jgi:hypothetical protein
LITEPCHLKNENVIHFAISTEEGRKDGGKGREGVNDKDTE